MRAVDLTGQRFGRLTVEGRALAIGDRRGAHWLCRCTCGGERIARATYLRSGTTTRCMACAMPGLVGPLHDGRRRLNEQTARLALWMLRYVTQRAVAFVVDVKQPTVSALECGKTWNHIDRSSL